MPTTLIKFTRRNLPVLGAITANRFEQYVKLAGRMKSYNESSSVEVLGPKVIEHGARIVEQGFNVEEIERLVAFLDDTLAKVETSRPFQLELMSAIEIVKGGVSED